MIEQHSNLNREFCLFEFYFVPPPRAHWVKKQNFIGLLLITGSADNLSMDGFYSKSVPVNRLNQQPPSNATNFKKSGAKKNSLSCFANALPSTSSRGYDPNKYRLHFAKESREEIDERKLDAQRRVLQMLPRESLEMSIDQVVVPNFHPYSGSPLYHFGGGGGGGLRGWNDMALKYTGLHESRWKEIEAG